MKKSNIDFPYCPECYTELHYYVSEPLELPKKDNHRNTPSTIILQKVKNHVN